MLVPALSHIMWNYHITIQMTSDDHFRVSLKPFVAWCRSVCVGPAALAALH